MKHFEFEISGSYDNIDYDYDEYGVSYRRGSAGNFTGGAVMSAESYEDAKIKVVEKIHDEVDGVTEISLVWKEITDVDPEEIEEEFYLE
jgi:glyoxylate utilization-related uncharacterized protein